MRPLICVDELARSLDDPTLVLLDVQWNLTGPPGADLYAGAHLPGAVHLDLDTAPAGPPGDGRGRHPLPEPEALERALRTAGVDGDSRVVAYDQRTSLSAARAWWVLRWAGLTEVRVLDGGLAAWESEGRPVTAAVPSPRPGAVTVRPGSLPVLTANDVLGFAATGILLDSRAPERFRGETEPLDPVAGHIPGAVNAPMAGYLREDGHFPTADVLRAYFAGHGVDGARPVGTSCGSGVTAAHTALALAEIGVEAALYVGSWSEWCSDPARPVALGG